MDILLMFRSNKINRLQKSFSILLKLSCIRDPEIRVKRCCFNRIWQQNEQICK